MVQEKGNFAKVKMKIFLKLRDGKDIKIYYSLNEKMYQIDFGIPFELNATLEQTLRFCPYTKLVDAFDDDKYQIDKVKH